MRRKRKEKERVDQLVQETKAEAASRSPSPFKSKTREDPHAPIKLKVRSLKNIIENLEISNEELSAKIDEKGDEQQNLECELVVMRSN